MSDPIAVVGMAARLPDAANLEQFWANLVAGRNSIHRLTEEDLLEAGADPEEIHRPGYVRARPLLDDLWGLDRRYFGMSERECVVRNPQHRLLLELCSSALQNAGYVPGHRDVIGLYAGCASDRYAEDHLRADPELYSLVGETGVTLANNTDYLTSFVSYRLGLTGPSIPVRTACSSSLVAVHMAAQALRAGECDIALAGGVEIEMPYGLGYLHVRGGVESADGVCRPLDARASGTVFGSGGGVVVLKRLDEALADGDTVWGLIRGSAVNNDGSERATFTSPSVEGQRQVIAEALAVAGVDPVHLSYVELHGTATQVGDPVEIQGLKDALSALAEGEPSAESCVIGSVKSNIGHLGPAAGVAGLIKTLLAMTHEAIPPVANFRTPNPLLRLERTPFRVADRLLEWPRTDTRPRLAGVSSFGFGGTNAHVVLGEGPRHRAPLGDARSAVPVDEDGSSPEPQLLLWSAYDESAESIVRRDLATALGRDGHRLADVAFTTQVGRRALPVRAALRTRSAKHAVDTLIDPAAAVTARGDGTILPVVLVFPDPAGAENDDIGWIHDLREGHASFATAMDECLDLFGREESRTLGTAGLSHEVTEAGRPASARERTVLLFAAEYALGQMLLDYGVRPVGAVGWDTGALLASTVLGKSTLAEAARSLCDELDLLPAFRAGATEADLPPAPGTDATEGAPLLWLVCGAADAKSAPWREFGVDATGQLAVGVLPPTDDTAPWDGVLDVLAQVWVHGTDVLWENLPRRDGALRIPLPHYPYARRPYLAPRRAVRGGSGS
ncbi:beta-ketoacyl synthase N-terminal-like domain-containing protein [Streptomyces nojiriensis]|uniref:beta-ketoacyl synthase N-terminal-like domain-containing protein n=1 Tax=Streptomyces nojiriensis TaxID=66374 RepID=UPI0035DA46FF